MPWARWLNPQNHLTGSQRYFYLVGGLQWFTDVLNLVFGVFLTLGAISSIFYERFSIRPLTGPLLIMPAVFLFLHLWRFLWVLRNALHLPARTALRSMYNFFSLGWVVTLACLQGLVQKKGVFLRTPKSRDDSKVLGALRVTQWETLIGLTFLGFGFLAFVIHPELKTFWLGFLLAWQGSLFLAAPYFSLLSIRSGEPAPTMRQPVLDRGRPVTESRVAKWAWVGVFLLGALVWLALRLPSPIERPSYAQLQPPDIPPQVLFGVDAVPTATAMPVTPAPVISTPLPAFTLPPVSTLIPTDLPTQTLEPTVTVPPSPSPTQLIPTELVPTFTPVAPTVVSQPTISPTSPTSTPTAGSQPSNPSPPAVTAVDSPTTTGP